MKSHHPEADQIVRRYIGAAEAPAPLGWGLDGVVYPHPTARDVLDPVRTYGIYYWDLKPRNLCFR